MCWVMPPASPATTSVSRIASSSEVLPWSTWPMIVTTGGRSSRSASASSKVGSTSTSSAAWMISIFLPNSSASTPSASTDSVWVSVAISPRLISFLITSGTATPSDSADSLTVEPELIRIVSGAVRSEEHTSELQSHSDLVCRLLLEKKKNTIDRQQLSDNLQSGRSQVAHHPVTPPDPQ